MSLLSNIVVNLYSILILLVICLHALRLFEKDSLKDTLYLMILYAAMAMLIFDILSRFDGNYHALYPVLNSIGNFMIFLMSPIIPSLWVAYVHLNIYCDEERTRRLIYPLCVINTVHAVILIISQFYGWFYFIDSNNIYHRGEFYIYSALVTVFLLFAAFVLVLVRRKKLNKKSYFSLIFFSIPPSISILLQIKFYGMSLILNSLVLSLLVVFLNIQNQCMNTDHLTEVSNRKNLDAYLKRKINSCAAEKGFSAILLDINDFKYINDTFGHNVGDQALETAANLLKNCLRENDFIARFGGDEFCIILDISNKEDLEAMISRINSKFETHNKNGTHLYSIGFSMGYAVYDKNLYAGAEDFLNHLDTLMYQQKQNKPSSNVVPT